MIKQSDLDEIIEKEVIGVAINHGSVSLSFASGSGESGWILIQCRFILQAGDNVFSGDATVPQSAAPLLGCLRKNIVDVHYDENKMLTLFFDDKQRVRLVPERDGLESYVLHTRQGIVPVIDFSK